MHVSLCACAWQGQAWASSRGPALPRQADLPGGSAGTGGMRRAFFISACIASRTAGATAPQCTPVRPSAPMRPRTAAASSASASARGGGCKGGKYRRVGPLGQSLEVQGGGRGGGWGPGSGSSSSRSAPDCSPLAPQDAARPARSRWWAQSCGSRPAAGPSTRGNWPLQQGLGGDEAEGSGSSSLHAAACARGMLRRTRTRCPTHLRNLRRCGPPYPPRRCSAPSCAATSAAFSPTSR